MFKYELFWMLLEVKYTEAKKKENFDVVSRIYVEEKKSMKLIR